MVPYLFPAHAGMNRIISTYDEDEATVPRTRGDEPSILPIFVSVKTCSPHTRG